MGGAMEPGSSPRISGVRIAPVTAPLLFFLLTAGSPLADVEQLTLYQRTARAPLVVRAKALTDSTRRPQLEVLEILKGSCASKILTVVPHFEDNVHPTPWLKREIFLKGEESLLFLTPYVDEYGRGEGPETFSVMNAAGGKLAIPAEGGDALLKAIHRFIGIVSSGQHDRQAISLRSLMGEKNPYMVEAGLQECLRLRLAESGDVVPLMALLQHQRPDFRTGALALLNLIVRDAAAVGQDLPARAQLFQRVAVIARQDADESARAAAVGVLEAYGDAAALSIIESIGRVDSSQKVRYEAQVAAYRLKQRGS